MRHAILRPVEVARPGRADLPIETRGLDQAIRLAARTLLAELAVLKDSHAALIQRVEGLRAQIERNDPPVRVERDNRTCRLSPRECQVLAMLSRGLSSKEMSRSLNISIGTVKSYRRTLYEKLRISKRSDAVAVMHERSAKQ